MENWLASTRDVAFVIPARNEAAFIDRAIRSVSEQTVALNRIEVVVVENGSSDATAEIARRALAKAPALQGQVMIQTEAGIAAAKNRGTTATNAGVLIFLDADSRAAPDLAETVLDWVGRGYPAGSIRVTADSADWLDRAFFGLIDWGKGLFGIHANMLYCERDLFLQVGGFGERIRLAEDLDFLVRLKRVGIRLCHVRDSWIATSPRRLHELPLRLGMVKMFGRWALAQLGIGRRWRY
jgi:glycosyltransferase involved in cell wall biosynthesis